MAKEKKPKRPKEFWIENALYPHVNKDKPPKITRHLNRQVLCGCCKFKCCNSEVFAVELTPKEVEKFQLPQLFLQEGRCRCLTEDAGCKYGAERPVFCRIYPVMMDFEGKQLYVVHWAVLHCPTPKHFVFDRMEGEKYVYKKRTDIRVPTNNIQDEIKLDKPLEEFPNVLYANEDGLTELFGAENVEKFKRDLAELNARDKGFDI